MVRFESNLLMVQVGFKLFGFIPGFVGLRGQLKPVDSSKDTVQVDFKPSEICIAGDSLSAGGSSDVTLKTTFLDSRVRLGQGSRGSLFVFTRGGASDSAGLTPGPPTLIHPPPPPPRPGGS